MSGLGHEEVAEVSRRTQHLQEQSERLERELQQLRQTHASREEELRREIRRMEGALEFKDSDVKQLQERICEEEVEREAERQRADRLQRIVTSSTEQVEALKAHIQSLQQVTRTQRLDAAVRLLEHDMQSNSDKLVLKKKDRGARKTVTYTIRARASSIAAARRET